MQVEARTNQNDDASSLQNQSRELTNTLNKTIPELGILLRFYIKNSGQFKENIANDLLEAAPKKALELLNKYSISE